jgi:tRNA pseudouridine38-40 synthase
VSDTAPNLTRFRATIQYDGTAFHGSQLQPNVRTVQGEIESALSKLLDTGTRVDMAGRTDTGVHALAQEIAFAAPSSWDGLDLGRGLSALLPPDISADAPRDGGPKFHPRFDAERRRYIYVVAPGAAGHPPFLRDLAWRTAKQRFEPGSGGEAVERLNGLADLVVGQHDFTAFARSGQPERGTRCAVEVATWRTHREGMLLFEIVADRFLHHMVRYLVGTMIEIAADRRPADDMARLIAGGGGARPVFPAPPGGLYLSGVRYSDGWNREPGFPW